MCLVLNSLSFIRLIMFNWILNYAPVLFLTVDFIDILYLLSNIKMLFECILYRRFG